MVDNVNPNSQFHPYQPMDATPQSDKMSGGLGRMMISMLKVDVRQTVE